MAVDMYVESRIEKLVASMQRSAPTKDRYNAKAKRIAKRRAKKGYR